MVFDGLSVSQGIRCNQHVSVAALVLLRNATTHTTCAKIQQPTLYGILVRHIKLPYVRE